MELLSKRYSKGEEIANSITHGIGILFSVVALTILLVFAITKRSPLAITAFSIYGLGSICLYTSSTLYHSFKKESLKRLFRIFDHSSIFIYIAGTYTPIALLALTGYWRIGILAGAWVIAISGIVYKAISMTKLKKQKIVSLLIYIGMGWISVIAFKPMTEVVSIEFFYWLLAGGLVYTVGALIYAVKKIPFNHAIWHGFVLAGSVVHFLAIFLYLA